MISKFVKKRYSARVALQLNVEYDSQAFGIKARRKRNY
jgi:hypothetical protein